MGRLVILLIVFFSSAEAVYYWSLPNMETSATTLGTQNDTSLKTVKANIETINKLFENTVLKTQNKILKADEEISKQTAIILVLKKELKEAVKLRLEER